MVEIKAPNNLSKTIFLAGGISGCPDWQRIFINLLKSSDFLFFNPRREFEPEDIEEQIEWEDHYLEKADIVVFWFPKETLCPITLFELGKMLVSPKCVIVGCHQDYKRRKDVIIQSQLIRGPHFPILDTLIELRDSLLDLVNFK